MTIRLRADNGDPQRPILRDDLTRRTPAVNQNAAATLELGIFRAGRPLDLTGYTNITLKVRPNTQLGVDLITREDITLDTAEISTDAWYGGTAENCTVELTDIETNYILNASHAHLHLVISATNPDDESEILGQGEIILVRDNNTPGVVKTGATFLTAAQLGQPGGPAAQDNLSNVDNTSDANKPVSGPQAAALNDKVNTSAIVDDLTTGGSNVPLSAEQGKELKGITDTKASQSSVGGLQMAVVDIQTNGLPSKADVGHTHALQSLDTNVTGGQLDGMASKLGGIEPGAEANRTPSQIKAAYEGNANTNAFTDGSKAKLDAVGAPLTVADAAARKTSATYDPAGVSVGVTRVIQTDMPGILWLLVAADVTQDASWIGMPYTVNPSGEIEMNVVLEDVSTITPANRTIGWNGDEPVYGDGQTFGGMPMRKGLIEVATDKEKYAIQDQLHPGDDVMITGEGGRVEKYLGSIVPDAECELLCSGTYTYYTASIEEYMFADDSGTYITVGGPPISFVKQGNYWTIPGKYIADEQTNYPWQVKHWTSQGSYPDDLKVYRAGRGDWAVIKPAFYLFVSNNAGQAVTVRGVNVPDGATNVGIGYITPETNLEVAFVVTKIYNKPTFLTPIAYKNVGLTANQSYTYVEYAHPHSYLPALPQVGITAVHIDIL